MNCQKGYDSDANAASGEQTTGSREGWYYLFGSMTGPRRRGN
jgi:hypothetical protein